MIRRLLGVRGFWLWLQELYDPKLIFPLTDEELNATCIYSLILQFNAMYALMIAIQIKLGRSDASSGSAASQLQVRDVNGHFVLDKTIKIWEVRLSRK